MTDHGVPAIRLEHLRKEFPGATGAAVADLSLDVDEGELVALVGPSGCGKTTTLKMINRIIEPTAGRIVVHGTDARALPRHELRRGIGYVIQEVGLLPHRTVAQNVATVPRLLGWSRERITARTDELVALVGLDRELLGRYPTALSGGQQQRVGVARALAADPPIMLMDEPYSAVDPIVRTRLQDELVELQRRLHKTIVFVTHDIDEAIKLGDRIVLLNTGAAIEQAGPPADVLRRPANEFVEDFLGRDRGLRRLALLTVADCDIGEGTVVPADATPAHAKEVMARNGVPWVGVVADGRVQGWTWGHALDGLDRVGDAELRTFAASVRHETSLREALEGIVNSHTRVAVVLDDRDRYLGMLTIDEISEAAR